MFPAQGNIAHDIPYLITLCLTKSKKKTKFWVQGLKIKDQGSIIFVLKLLHGFRKSISTFPGMCAKPRQ